MFITVICAPRTLGQPPNFEPESMRSFSDDGDDVVQVYITVIEHLCTLKWLHSSLTIHHHMVDLFSYSPTPTPFPSDFVFVFCQFVLAFFYSTYG